MLPRTCRLLLALAVALAAVSSSADADAQNQECVASASDPNTCLSVNEAAGDEAQKEPELQEATVDDDEEDDYEEDEEDYEEDEDDEEGEVASTCKDDHEKCASWAVRGECTANPNYMHKYCQLSCNTCPGNDDSTSPGSKDENSNKTEVDGAGIERRLNPDCKDDHTSCEIWAGQGECKNNPRYMQVNCALSCRTCSKYMYTDDDLARGADLGEPQEIGRGGQVDPRIADTIAEGRRYLFEEVPDKFNTQVIDICQNKHAKCALWAAVGECEANPNYMKKNCAPVCKSCEVMTVEGRCPLDPDAPKAWAPGDLNKMFTRLSSEPYLSKYNVEVLSSPATDGPWVLTMDLLSDDEAQTLIDLGAAEGYDRSADVGKMKPDGTYEKSVNERRTSTNAWCTGNCFEDPTAQAVVARLSNITGIDDTNSENLQMLRYEPGQFYRTHHDYIPHHVKRQCGVRILTIYLYLNDVEAGGGTNFDILDLTVMPKRGRALLWPSVKDENPDEKDPRTSHQALPVLKGVKYGANAWVHQGDFKTANKNGCT